MKNHFVLFGILAMACTGDAGTKDSGATDSGGACSTEDFYDGPVSIDEATVDCSGDQVTFFARTTGWTDGGWVFTQETGNTEPQWADQHQLDSVRYDECGLWDELERTISDGSTLADPTQDWQENVSSVFTCDAHYGDGNVITYAFAVVDYEGNFADCIVYGDDPTGLTNDDYNRLADPVGFDESDCNVGTNTM